MKVRVTRRSGITLLEVMILMAVLAVIAVAVLLPRLARCKARACRISCINNLKQVGLGVRQWAMDHGDRYLMKVPVSEGGTMNHPRFNEPWVHWLVLSNEINTPRVLICPEDLKRVEVWDFNNGLSNQNVSYFVGLEAMEETPSVILSGDRNLTADGAAIRPGLYTLNTNEMLGWTKSIHRHYGNVGFSDGSVQQFSSQGLQEFLLANPQTNRLAIP